MERFRELVDELPYIGSRTTDQAILIQVARTFPKVTRTLPKEWDTHLGHGWRSAPHTLLHYQERVGMAHFTGRLPQGNSYMDTEAGVLKYCVRTRSCCMTEENRQDFMKTWGLWTTTSGFLGTTFGILEKARFRLDTLDTR